MSRISKRMKSIKEKTENNPSFELAKAVSTLKECATVKFDETVELTFHLGVDPRKADQMVRGVVDLPHGTGRKIKILVFCADTQADDAKASGADYAGFESLYEKVKEGWVDFDVVIATPELMRDVGKLGKVLGPKGLMPSPKAGTVTKDVDKAVQAIKKGKIEYRVDKTGGIAVGVGKVSFGQEKIEENVKAVIDAVHKAKPAAAKGEYMKSVFLSSTMGPGLRINLNSKQLDLAS